ncbi:2'-5' RNA ligase family protein [Conyzicola sp.]|uniref:2'-5' RNA ligase family protein n=1 Tax=Conyzicola sp. TaxID=1969404 RepID=UPI003989D65F
MNDAAAPRPAVVSLELLLDDELESRIRAEWQALQAAGLSSLGAHTAPSNRPHITLVVRTHLPPMSTADLGAIITLPIPVTLGGVILFGTGDRRVLARSIVPTEALLALHASLHALAGDGDDAPHTRPGEWTPHITLARRLRLDSLPQALSVLDEVNPTPPRPAFAASLRRWDAATATVTTLLD